MGWESLGCGATEGAILAGERGSLLFQAHPDNPNRRYFGLKSREKQ
ncbi:hypothetical protein SBF1_8000002 [Candidatus Desulfosporosinus infrequens]|uniref:Uncharacterized protein n=1 Tax=Candidatus Desulfosporosinus infrequens TaxID=2043169 RepID=A0A2U3LTF2_9FIRM|nr:hypothetical protein SBF1_8000002 [Candidatus Desulfosporosinus infrequens]